MNNYKKGQDAYDKKDYDIAISYWKPLAEEGHEEAINSMGSLYSSENLIPSCLPQDTSQALYYFKKGALKGNNYSLFRLGMFYEKGLEVKQDRQKARELFRKAWEKGEARSVYALATSNYYDEFNPDYKEAYFCFNALSEVNQSDAHFFLADMCMYGKGVKKDYAEAYKHLILAGITENEEERKYWEDGLSNTEEYTRAINRGVWLLHKELTKLINPIELNRAKHLAKEFQRKYY